jgi:ceramide glucosyltransferase
MRLTLEIIALFGTLCAWSYYLFCLWSVRSFRRQGKGSTAHFTPPVTILKPMRGLDREAYANLSSHCRQDYPEYEIIFGVADAHDPAVPVIERLMREFRERAIRLVVCPPDQAANSKVSSLMQMLPHARYDYLVVNDSDIRVPGDYLRRVMEPLGRPPCGPPVGRGPSAGSLWRAGPSVGAGPEPSGGGPRVGMVTCPYRGVPGGTFGSRLEAIGINTEFHAGVLVARKMEGVRFGLGATLAFSRAGLEAAGGFESLRPYLADDFHLGQRMAAAGYEVVLSDCVVENYLPDYSPGDFLRHQLRWGRTIRHSRPGGYAGRILTFGLLWAMLAVILAPGSVASWGLLGATVLLRLGVALAVGVSVLGDRRVLRDLWLVPLSDFLGVWIWMASYAGRRVAWRGEEFVLEGGKLRPA